MPLWHAWNSLRLVCKRPALEVISLGITVMPRQKEPSMQSALRVLCRRAMRLGTGLVLVLFALAPAALAWNKAGHMVSGAIAYADLKQDSPQTLERVIALLKAHPHYETRWERRLAPRDFLPV